MNPALVLGQALIGWLIADLLSGLVHWWEDRCAEQRWPLIGRLIVAPNRLHHTDVLAFTRSGLIERNLPAWLAVALISGIWLASAGPSVVWVTATIGGAMAGEVHRLAHQPASAGVVARILQEMGVFQSPKHHAGHHRAPADRRYCVLSNWTNPALDALGVWTALELTLAQLGMTPNRGTR